MENVRNRVNIRLVTSRHIANKLAIKPNFDKNTIFCENLVAVHMKKTQLKLDKPIYLGAKIIQGFVGLRAKLYAYKMLDGKEEKKCKGIRKPVIKKDISFEDYKECLFSGCEQMRKMNIIRSRKHTLYTEEVNKVAMSANDDKRVILPDRVHTLAIGHYKTL